MSSHMIINPKDSLVAVSVFPSCFVFNTRLIIPNLLGLSEAQSLWVNSFDDYIDDFVYFVHTITKDFPQVPVFVLAHSMGGFIVANAVSRIPTLVNRAVLCAPMLRMKCGTKATDWKYPLPQPLTYWITNVVRYLGLGSSHALGFYKEKPTDKINLNVYTSDQGQLDKWIALRQKYPNLITTCVTNDWVYHSIRAQRRFAERYQFVHTNTLILRLSAIFLSPLNCLCLLCFLCHVFTR